MKKSYMKKHLTHIFLLTILISLTTLLIVESVLSIDECTMNHEPYQPTQPYPAYMSINVTRNLTLTWNCTDSDNDSLVYDVYFDTFFPLQKKATKQCNTSYTPSLLHYNTRYYWMIIAYDPCEDISISHLWTFTTEQNQHPHPSIITLVQPQMNAANISLSAPLSVTVTDEDLDPLRVTFYDETDTIIGTTEGTSEDIFTIKWNNLTKNTTYTWYVTVSDGSYLITSDQYTFTTINKTSHPIAILEHDYHGSVNEEILFDSSASYDPDGTITGYRWDFNHDGTWDTTWQQTPTIAHLFTDPGNYTIVVQIKDNDGLINTSSSQAFITMNHAPQMPDQPNGPSNIYVNSTVTFSSSSTDPDNDIIRYGWDWNNDSIVDEWTEYYSSGIIIQSSHNWNNSGTYPIQVIAEDIHGASSFFSDKKIIEVQQTDDQNCPTIPTNPNPANNTKNISPLGQYIEWESTTSNTTNTTYTIYLNTSPTFDEPYKENVKQQRLFSGRLQKNTTYYWKIVAINQQNDCQITGPIWTFGTTNNLAPTQPTKPSPANGQTNVDTCSTTLSWESTDADNDPLYYTVYFHDKQNPKKILSSKSTHSSTSVNELTYDTTYYWFVEVTDNKGETIRSMDWSFTTKPKPCRASIDGPNDMYSGEEIMLSGSRSECETGQITSYRWDFGDGETATGETVQHVFRGNETYKVTLTITCKPDCQICSDTATHLIHVGNHPPKKPEIIHNDLLPFIGGQIKGKYTFKVKGNDVDGDQIRFRFEWGDNTSNTITEYVLPNEEVTVSHTWEKEGNYKINIYAEDIGGDLSLPVHITASIGSAMNIAMIVIVLLGMVIVSIQVVFVILAHRKKMFE